MLESLLRERYHLISVLGVGGFGQTYLAQDRLADDAVCVVKQFKPAKTEPRFLEIARRLFDTEIATLRRLGQHLQIPTFLDFFEEAGEFYLVQEFIDGHSISDECTIHHRLSEAEAIDLLRDVLGILSFVHSQQVIHRDIKPSNLIRRQSDGRVVLIDFGAVKEIGTQLLSEEEQKFTVGIGTQGYTPSEQLAGRPRYCSDLYALGMTAIQGLTGIQPTQILSHPETGDPVWQASISRGLQDILTKMVRYHFSQRYQSAEEVLQVLDHLSELPLASTMIPDSSVEWPDSLLHHSIGDDTLVDSPVVDTPVARKELRRRLNVKAIALTALSVTGLLAGLRQVGGLQAAELAVYDQWVRLEAQRKSVSVDPRLLLVEIREADLQALQRGTPSDADVAQVIRNLRKYQPRVIGLDLHRDLPQEPGHRELMQELQSPDVVTIMKLGNDQQMFDIPPPQGVPDDRLGFNDFPIDPDRAVRRNLLYATVNNQPFTSFALQLATHYLKTEPQTSSTQAGVMQLNQTDFPPITPTTGGYQTIDAAGYQILLNYRSPQAPAPQLSFTSVLQDKLDPAWVKDKVVLIGTTAISGKDFFRTPFQSGSTGDYLMPGVVVHAQMVSQILSAASGQTPLLKVWPDWAELLWIGGWAVVGASLVWTVWHPLRLAAAGIMVIILLVGSTYLMFVGSVWLPCVTPMIALLLSAAGVIVWHSYKVTTSTES